MMIINDKVITLAKELYLNPHPLFGLEHGIHVAENANKIMDSLEEAFNIDKRRRELITYASLLHDAAFDSQKALLTHGIDSIQKLTRPLQETGLFSENEIKMITNATARHSRHAWDKIGRPQTIDEKIVYDSDQIEWLNIRGILKYKEISENIGKSFDQYLIDLPNDLANRYNNLFLNETKKRIHKDFLDIMKLLGCNPLDYIEFPEVFEITETILPTKYGSFKVKGYVCNFDDLEALVVIKNDAQGDNQVIRVHSECFTGEVLYSERCDCRIQLKHSLQLINKLNVGVVIYLRQEGRGIGLMNKLKAYTLQDKGYDTVDANLALGFCADERDYRMAALILKDLGIDNIKLLTNNPAKIKGLEQYGITVKERIKTEKNLSKYCEKYLDTKIKRMGHLL